MPAGFIRKTRQVSSGEHDDSSPIDRFVDAVLQICAESVPALQARRQPVGRARPASDERRSRAATGAGRATGQAIASAGSFQAMPISLAGS